MNPYVQKVCPVILRQRVEQWQILAFRHPLAGTQLIKGNLEVGELPEDAVLRELAEESGIDQATVVVKIGELKIRQAGQHWHIYLCQPNVQLAEEWAFFTVDGGGLLFRFYWHPINEEPDASWRPVYRSASVLDSRVVSTTITEEKKKMGEGMGSCLGMGAASFLLGTNYT